MNLKSGYPFWLIKNGLPYEYPKLNSDIQTRVVVLGGGISGALTAYHLAEAGIECIVLDSRSIGLGSTCASTSLLQYEIDTPLFELTEMIGKTNASRAYNLCADSIIKLGKIAEKVGLSDFSFRPSIYFAAGTKDYNFLQKEYIARKKAGFDVSFLEEKELERTFGFKASGAIVSGLAAEADAYSMTHLLHQHNIKKGVRVFDRTEVGQVVPGKNKLDILTVNGRKIRAKKIVYATGYEVTQILSAKIVKLKTTYASISEAFPGDDKFWPKKALLWNTANPYLYMRTTSDHRIIVGGRDDMHYQPKLMARSINHKTKLLVRDFNRVFPGIEFIPEFSWAGVFGSTKDGLPYIGPYKNHPHSLFSLGFGGNGITFSLVGAEIIRDLCLGKKNSDAHLFSFDR